MLDPRHRRCGAGAWQGDQVESWRQFVLSEAKGFAEAAFPTVADDRVACFPRDDQADPRVGEVVLAGVEDNHAVALRASPREDAIEFRLFQQSSRSVEGEVAHLADRFAMVRPIADGVDVGLTWGSGFFARS